MVGNNLGRLDGGRKDNCLMTLHNSGHQLLKAFSAIPDFSGGTPNFTLVVLAPEIDLQRGAPPRPFFFPASFYSTSSIFFSPSHNPAHPRVFINDELISSPSISPNI